MPKSFQQKLKILYLMRVFSEKTDEAHPMSVKDLISYLESLGIHAERKTIYDDIETLRVFGMDIMNRRERPSGFYLASREFETAVCDVLRQILPEQEEVIFRTRSTTYLLFQESFVAHLM